MNQLDNTLIENALALCGKTMEDMEIDKYIRTTPDGFCIFDTNFSIEKFCYYLLSFSFQEEFYYKADVPSDGIDRFSIVGIFGQAIYEYQSGNEKPLIELLSKIGK